MPTLPSGEERGSLETQLSELNQNLRVLRKEVTSLRASLFRSPCEPEERAWRFRRERLDAIAEGHTPIPLQDGPRLVLHVLPCAAFASERVVDVRAAELDIFGSGGSPYYNADGKFIWPDTQGGQQRAYAQVTRAGCIEAVKVLHSDSHSKEDAPLHVAVIERLLLTGVKGYMIVLNKLGIDGPVDVVATLADVRGSTMTSPYDLARVAILPIAVSEVALPALRLSQPAAPHGGLERAFRPVLDALWQAGGWSQSGSFDADGDYRGH